MYLKVFKSVLKHKNINQWYVGDIAMLFKRHQCIFNIFACI